MMQPEKYHHQLPGAARELLSGFIGAGLEMICAEQMILDSAAGENSMGPELFLYTSGETDPCVCRLTERQPADMPVYQELNLQPEPSPGLHHVRWMMPAWFIIRKIEIWAERIRDQQAATDKECISENTLLISGESGEEILITPDHPAPGFLVSRNPAEIEQILGSGRYFLKTITD